MQGRHANHNSLFITMAFRSATGLILDQLVCALNEPISFDEKKDNLGRLKRSCEAAIVEKFEYLKDREVFVCDFAKLQFPHAEEARSLNHIPIR